MRLSFVVQRLVLIGILLLWCTVLVAFRLSYKAENLFSRLWWNLFLATIPLLCSSMMQWSMQQRKSVLSKICFVVWILFLPNAPYILTDLFHLRYRYPVPLWLDLALLLSFAGAGLMFCYLSLADVQALIQQRYGRRAGWSVAFGSLMLCGLGIFLGRYLRWNSWQVFTHPVNLIQNAASRIGVDSKLPNPLEVTFVYGIGLILGYLTLHLFANAIRGTNYLKG